MKSGTNTGLLVLHLNICKLLNFHYFLLSLLKIVFIKPVKNMDVSHFF